MSYLYSKMNCSPFPELHNCAGSGVVCRWQPGRCSCIWRHLCHYLKVSLCDCLFDDLGVISMFLTCCYSAGNCKKRYNNNDSTAHLIMQQTDQFLASPSLRHLKYIVALIILYAFTRLLFHWNDWKWFCCYAWCCNYRRALWIVNTELLIFL